MAPSQVSDGVITLAAAAAAGRGSANLSRYSAAHARAAGAGLRWPIAGPAEIPQRRPSVTLPRACVLECRHRSATQARRRIAGGSRGRVAAGTRVVLPAGCLDREGKRGAALSSARNAGTARHAHAEAADDRLAGDWWHGTAVLVREKAEAEAAIAAKGEEERQRQRPPSPRRSKPRRKRRRR